MAPSTEDNDEHRPLLNGDRASDHGAIERTAGTEDDREDPGAAAAAAAEEDDEVDSGPTTLQMAKIMSSVWVGTFLAAMDGTMVATLTAPISASFHSLTLLSWLASAYFIANAALQPLAGKLTDIFGRRAGLIFSNVLFAAGNLICGLARDEWLIIFGRVVAGMGGGGLNAISTFIASDLIPLRRRGVWQGVGNICFGVGAGVGGVFGGWVNDRFGWRWSFLTLVPLTVVSGTLVFFTVKIPVKDTDRDRWRRIDFLGATLLVSTLVLLLMGLNSGGNVVPWTHPLVLATLPLSAVSLAAYIYVEARVAAEPIIPVQLLTKRTTLAACLTNWFLTMAVFGVMFYVPVYFQARGYSATQAGERLVSQAAGVALGSVTVGLVMRRLGRYWWLNVGVQATFLLGMVLVCTLDADTPDWPPFLYFFFTGGGYSGMLTVSLISLISAVDHRFQAVITSASYAFRSTGSTIGITIASAVFQNVLTSTLWARLGDRKHAAEYLPRVRDSLDEIKKLPIDWQRPVVESYVDASRAAFLALLGLGVLGSVVSLFMREHKLHNTISRRDS